MRRAIGDALIRPVAGRRGRGRGRSARGRRSLVAAGAGSGSCSGSGSGSASAFSAGFAAGSPPLPELVTSPPTRAITSPIGSVSPSSATISMSVPAASDS